MNNVLLGGDGWVHYETIGGGQGARPWADGMSGVHTAMTNTLDTPVEALGARAAAPGAPLRAARGQRRRGRAPRAATASGVSSRRSRRREVSLVTERRTSAPPGLAGGEPGAVGENWLLPGGRRGAAPSAARQVHGAPRAGRRAAHPHPGRRWLGTACLTSVERRGRSALDRRLELRRASSATVSICSRGSSMRRRPLVMRCSRSATKRGRGSAAGRATRRSRAAARATSRAPRARRGRRASSSAARPRRPSAPRGALRDGGVGHERAVEQHLDAGVRARPGGPGRARRVEQRVAHGAVGRRGTTPTRGTRHRSRGGTRRRRPASPPGREMRTRAMAARSGNMQPTRKSADGAPAAVGIERHRDVPDQVHVRRAARSRSRPRTCARGPA